MAIQSINQALSNLGNNLNFNNAINVISGIPTGVLQKSQTTETLNSAYDSIADGAMVFSPVGTVIGGAMKVGALVGDGLTAMGLGTDLMTTTDQILDSNFLKLGIVGLSNALGAERSETIISDNETISELGGSYQGTVNRIQKALAKSGKKYGMFSSGSRRSANRLIKEAERLQSIMLNINQNRERELLLSSNNLLGNTYQLNMYGGPQPMISAKLGTKIDLIKKLNIKNKHIYTAHDYDGTFLFLKSGGNIEYELFKRSVNKHAPDLLKENNYNMERYWELNGKPNDWNMALLKNMFTLEEDGKYHAHTIAWNKDGEGEWMKSSNHPTSWMEEAWFDGYSIDKNNNKIPLEGEELEKWKNFKENYYLEEIDGKRKYKPKFKNGGSIKSDEKLFELPNVIPDGALHKNKHHIENSEGWTQKGIPVIDNDNILHAEVEKEEIIFNLEVTKKLEELQKKYYDEDLKNRDSFAIEAGKLLVELILYNTDDRTSLIDRIDETK